MAEDITDDSTEDTKPPPAKRSLFSKDAQAKASSEAEQAVAFFSRSHEIFPQRLAEEERRRQKNIAKLERKRSSGSVERRQASPPEEKKRRISARDQYSSGEDSAGILRSRRKPIPSRRDSHKSDSLPAQQGPESSPTTLSGAYARDLRAERRVGQEPKKNTPAIISLSDSDSDKETKFSPARKATIEPVVLDDDEDNYVVARKATTKDDYDLQLSDEEFPELIQLAREREKQKALQRRNAVETFEQQNHAPSKGVAVDDDIFQTTKLNSSEDPIAEILLTSQIEGSKPLMVKRKLSQRLKEVRIIWCDRQSFQGQSMSADLKDTVFLSWRGKRLFDSTTCMALGLSVDSLGKLTADGDGVDEEGRVHLEVWTEELYSAHQKMQDAKAKEGDLDVEEELPEKVESSIIRLVLKARGLDDFKLKVKPTTTVERIIQSFRHNKNIPVTSELSLYVDGDKLDSSSRVEDAELENMDVVEVHIR